MPYALDAGGLPLFYGRRPIVNALDRSNVNTETGAT